MIAGSYFPDGIMKDICEQYDKCNTDEHSFKAYLSRWMGHSTQMAPFTYDKSIALLKSSAKAAAAQCTGGSSGTTCGLKWYLNGTWDGSDGVGQQMAALEVFQSTMIQHVAVPLTNSTGGTSISDPTAGHNSSAVLPAQRITPPTKREKAGAWVLTAFIAIMAVWTCWFMWTSAWEAEGDAPAGALNEKSNAVLDLKGKEKAVDTKIESNKSTRVVPSIEEEERGVANNAKYRDADQFT
jgi:mannan endo-1,6-alpha-mannosidase